MGSTVDNIVRCHRKMPFSMWSGWNNNFPLSLNRVCIYLLGKFTENVVILAYQLWTLHCRDNTILFFVLKRSKNCQNVCKEASWAGTYQVLPSSEGTRLFSSSHEAPWTVQRRALGFCGDDDGQEECSREGKTKERYFCRLVFSVGDWSDDNYSDVGVFTNCVKSVGHCAGTNAVVLFQFHTYVLKYMCT